MVMKINWALNWILNSLNQIKLLFLDFICSRNCGFVFFLQQNNVYLFVIVVYLL